jgi:hypothetical protein
MVLMFSILFSCLKQTEASKAQTVIQLPIITVLDYDGGEQSTPLPIELHQSIEETLAKRNINVVVLPVPNSFQYQRLSSQRISSLEKYPSLLVESKAQFFSQLNGRFRWEVTLKLTLVQTKEEQLIRQSTIPVFHQFHHEREEEALLAAETLILREINILIDDYLRGI